MEVSGLIEETDSGAEGEDNIVLENDVSFTESEDETQNKDLRKHLDKVLPELTESNAKELAAEIARGGNITIPEKQMEENIMHNLKAIRRQNEINEAVQNQYKNIPITETTRDYRKRRSQDSCQDNYYGRRRPETLPEEIKSNIRRRAGENINKAYGRHRDKEYPPARKTVRSRLGQLPDRRPISSRLGKKNSVIQQEKNRRDTRSQNIRVEDVDETKIR